MREQQGQRANRSGRLTEDTIVDRLMRLRVKHERQKVMGTTIYGTALRTDVFVAPTTQFPRGLCIEAKGQDVGGSVDEKFPYLVANVKAGVFPCPVVVVVDGRGARAGAVEWLRQQADGVQLLNVFSIEEFLTWTKRSL